MAEVVAVLALGAADVGVVDQREREQLDLGVEVLGALLVEQHIGQDLQEALVQNGVVVAGLELALLVPGLHQHPVESGGVHDLLLQPLHNFLKGLCICGLVQLVVDGALELLELLCVQLFGVQHLHARHGHAVGSHPRGRIAVLPSDSGGVFGSD